MSRLYVLFAFLAWSLTTEAQPLSCLDGVCANGNDCVNLTTSGGTLIGPGCGCKVNTFGFDCDSCISASDRGGASFIDDISAEQVRDIITIQFIISAILATFALVCSIRAWSSYRNWHEHDLNQSTRTEVEGKDYVAPQPHAVKVRPSKSTVFIDDISWSHFYLLTGSVLYSVGIFTPKAFNDDVAGIFYHLTRQTDCEYFPGFVFSGLVLMILGYWWEMCHQWRIMSMTKEAAEGKTVTSDTIGKMYKALNENDRPGAAKWAGWYAAFVLIIVRWANAKIHGTRSCCELLITSDAVDLAYISICIAWLGIAVAIRFWVGWNLVQGYKSIPQLGKDSPGFAYGAWQQAVCTFWGARGEMWSFLFFVYDLVAFLVGLAAFVFLILDAAAYSSSHNPGDTEPSIKGVVLFFVFEFMALIRLFLYHWNIKHFTINMLEKDKAKVAAENAHVLQHASACEGPAARRYNDAWQAAQFYRAPINDVPIMYSDPAMAALEYCQNLYADEARRRALKACKYAASDD